MTLNWYFATGENIAHPEHKNKDCPVEGCSACKVEENNTNLTLTEWLGGRPLIAENIEIDQRYVFEEVVRRLKTIAGWAAGKDFETVEREYEQHKKEYPELHE